MWPCLGTAELVVCYVVLCSLGLRQSHIRWTVQRQGPRCALCEQGSTKLVHFFFVIFHFSCHIVDQNLNTDWLGTEMIFTTWMNLYNNVSCSELCLLSATLCCQPQPQTKVALTQTTLRQSHNFIVTVVFFSPIWPWYVIFPVLLSKIFGESIREGHKTKTVTTMITVKNNQWSRAGWLMAAEKRWTACFALSFLLHTWFFFCVFSIRLLVHSKLSAAYAVRHYAQRGSGTCTDSPGSFRGAGCCLFSAISQVGTVCTWSLSHILWGWQRLANRIKYGWYRLNVAFRDELSGLFAEQWCLSFLSW